MKSKYLNGRAILGLNRIGDLIIPGNARMPSFSNYGCVDHIDDLVHYAPHEDIKDLGLVLSVFSFLPDSILNWMVQKMSQGTKYRGSIGVLLRQLNMGIRGLVFSLYYSEKPGNDYKETNPTELIGFTVNKVSS